MAPGAAGGGGGAQQQSTSASQTPHISPAELSYLFDSLSLPEGPIRPDGRSPTQFRPLTAETGILPGTNGSARIGFADGTEAIVGVKAEVEKTTLDNNVYQLLLQQDLEGEGGGEEESSTAMMTSTGQSSWVQMSIEIPGFRDDDALPVFLAEMMREALVGTTGTSSGREAESEADNQGKESMVGGLKGRLVINRRWHWRLYIDVGILLFLLPV
jgi:exosome complex component RRP42